MSLPFLKITLLFLKQERDLLGLSPAKLVLLYNASLCFIVFSIILVLNSMSCSRRSPYVNIRSLATVAADWFTADSAQALSYISQDFQITRKIQWVHSGGNTLLMRERQRNGQTGLRKANWNNHSLQTLCISDIFAAIYIVRVYAN